jgi:hypothetical protein
MKTLLGGCSFLFVIFIFSCTPVVPSDSENPDVPFTALEQSSALFPETGQPGEYQFFSNDSSHLQPYGMSFWTKKLVNQDPFSQLDISLHKISGNSLAGYGVIFCHGLRGDPAVETMLLIMINLNREYIIGEVEGDSFSTLIPWTYSEFLVSGYNQENRILITYDALEEEFDLSINGYFIISFSDNEEPVHASGNSGFVTVISPLDIFPEKPVEILFQVH